MSADRGRKAEDGEGRDCDFASGGCTSSCNCCKVGIIHKTITLQVIYLVSESFELY